MGEVNNISKLASQKNILLNFEVPSYRQAYSDRTAWLMSYLSELAYIRFNPLLPSKVNQEGLEKALNKLISDASTTNVAKVVNLISGLLYDHKKEETKLKSELHELDQARLLETFDTQKGTQAFLVDLGFAYTLAFRGTEANSLDDIKSDTHAVLTKCPSGGNVHSGFKTAYESVEESLINTLSKLDEKKPLFITGHSLGGALATIAAKRLKFEHGIAACYTFGSPRVGDSEWISTIKTPIYRLVNAADAVTMLPPNSVGVGFVSSALGLLPYIGTPFKKLILSKFHGFIHAGNMRYLTNCPAGDYAGVKLLYSVSLLFRLKALLLGKLPYKKFLSDHSISVYRKKLAIVAQSKNQPD